MGADLDNVVVSFNRRNKQSAAVINRLLTNRLLTTRNGWAHVHTVTHSSADWSHALLALTLSLADRHHVTSRSLTPIGSDVMGSSPMHDVTTVILDWTPAYPDVTNHTPDWLMSRRWVGGPFDTIIRL